MFESDVGFVLQPLAPLICLDRLCLEQISQQRVKNQDANTDYYVTRFYLNSVLSPIALQDLEELTLPNTRIQVAYKSITKSSLYLIVSFFDTVQVVDCELKWVWMSEWLFGLEAVDWCMFVTWLH